MAEHDGETVDEIAHPVRTATGLQIATIAWMLTECGVALWSAMRAHSPALLAFGADSLVELFSASVVLLQFMPRFALRQNQAERMAGALLYALAVGVTGTAITALGMGVRPETSAAGMAITVAALVAMPWLAWKKRRLARQSGNAALAADAVQSATCAYLAAITLLGLAVNAIWHAGWVDSAAALAAVPLIVLEARRTQQGN